MTPFTPQNPPLLMNGVFDPSGRTGIPYDSIRDIKESELCRFSRQSFTGEARIFVNHDCEFKHLIPHIQRFAPVWLYWGQLNDKNSRQRDMSPLNHLRPSTEEISAVQRACRRFDRDLLLTPPHLLIHQSFCLSPNAHLLTAESASCYHCISQM